MKRTHTLAAVIKQYGPKFYTSCNPSPYIRKTLRVLHQCRTASMGGHVDVCTDTACGHVRISYNSCRNRHCPACQNTQKEAWIARMQYRMLPVKYYHVVFTIPHEFNGLCIRYPALMYDLLFKVAWNTVKGFAANAQYGVLKTGMTALLHTWGSNLSLHPHLHCIIPAGGIQASGIWKNLKGNNGKKGGEDFLFPMDEFKKAYKSKFMEGIRKLIKQRLIVTQSHYTLNEVFNKEWVIYAKKPFGGAAKAIDYIGRYSHKVAITNHRLLKVDENGVKFAYKSYADNGKTKTMSLAGDEFLRRFAQHILPPGFTKIRHFGFHSGACHKQLDAIHEQLCHKPRQKPVVKTWQQLAFEKSEYIEAKCPKCQHHTLQTVGMWHQGKAPPAKYNHLINSTIQ